MTLYEHYQIERAEGREEGLTQGRAEACISHIESLMKNADMTLEDACKALNTTVEEYNAAKTQIESNQ